MKTVCFATLVYLSIACKQTMNISKVYIGFYCHLNIRRKPLMNKLRIFTPFASRNVKILNLFLQAD